MASGRLLYTASAITRLPTFALLLIAIFALPMSVQAQQPPQPRIERIYIPDDYTPPPGAFVLAVQVINLGGPAKMGWITVSSPDDHPLGLSYGEPGVTLMEPHNEPCYPPESLLPLARLYGPGTACPRDTIYSPDNPDLSCPFERGTLSHPMAELAWGYWPGNVSHTHWVDVYPQKGVSTVRLHVRTAMQGFSGSCDYYLEPNEAESAYRDQQRFPTFEWTAKLASTFEDIDPKTRAVLATVQIVAVDNDTGDPLWTGSGSLIDPRGYVLTNLHVVWNGEKGISCIDEARCRIGVGLLDAADPFNRPPHDWYHAYVVDIDQWMDLAVLKLDSTWEGDILPPYVEFPTVQLGDSGELVPGDELTIVGFPGVGGETVTLTRGQVSGFVQGLIKTDANISPGNSGGAALNARYQLVGVPTWSLVSQESVAKMAYVRPINDALPLLSRAIRDGR